MTRRQSLGLGLLGGLIMVASLCLLLAANQPNQQVIEKVQLHPTVFFQP
ncbi:MAG: hypothetical protein KGS46_19460 [Chloroflexi bacterium]|jgi:hypothetical protein|nr:hypothetical protein [Chloroflexota bacterium]